MAKKEGKNSGVGRDSRVDLWGKITQQRVQGPERRWLYPLQALMLHRQQILKSGREAYVSPSRVTISEDYAVAWPTNEYPFGSGSLFAAKGMRITRDEAYLAGAFGRKGVQDNLDMTVAMADGAGAGWAWIETKIERPAEEKVNSLFGPGRGRPASSDQTPFDVKATRRKRINSRVKRGRKLLVKYFGKDWQRVAYGGEAPEQIAPKRKGGST